MNNVWNVYVLPHSQQKYDGHWAEPCMEGLRFAQEKVSHRYRTDDTRVSKISFHTHAGAGPKEATPPKIKQNIFPCKCPRGYSLTPALTAHTIPETSSYLPRCSSSSSRRRQRQQHLYAEAGLIRDALRLGCNFCVRLMSGTIVCFLYLCARANGWGGKVFFGKNFCLHCKVAACIVDWTL